MRWCRSHGPSGTGYSSDIAIFSANDELVVNDVLIVDTSFPLRFIINKIRRSIIICQTSAHKAGLLIKNSSDVVHTLSTPSFKVIIINSES